ncbi:MAG TPA: FeoA domain-containing protein [Pirellulaceae bacterium]|nr:FeoA domain-containing protein [Pirellulaceae bacterium]HMO92016.1 FeoA domain-containing protein [Pirellulaceae bacterium]HMP68815.1 FeoA domain-containing protein [Pirellulaceae bacterium]
MDQKECLAPRSVVPIACLRSGECGAIFEVSGEESSVQRLSELGIQPGNRVEVVRHGCPCIIRLRGAKFCLRGDDCHCVMVAID